MSIVDAFGDVVSAEDHEQSCAVVEYAQCRIDGATHGEAYQYIAAEYGFEVAEEVAVVAGNIAWRETPDSCNAHRLYGESYADKALRDVGD